MADVKNNPLLNGTRVGKYDAVPFDLFKLEHFEPAFDYALEMAKKDIEVIKENKDKPNFENTIVALETSGELLDYVTSIYYNLYGVESDNKFKDLSQKFSPKLSEYGSMISMDDVLFQKVKSVYDMRENLELDKEQLRLLENSYKGFVRNGALLDDDKKEQLKEISKEISILSPQFSQNLLNATNDFELYIEDENQLSGLPENAKAAAAYLAKSKGKDSGWMFNLQPTSIMPILKYADNRDLREKINKAYNSRGNGEKFNNQEILKKIATLRYKKAQLLGFKTHAEYVIKERMAETPENVNNFLERIYKIAMPKAVKEVDELKSLAKELDGIDELQAWDSAYYSEKLRQKLYNFDAEELRPYFKSENVIDGIFKVANKLYGLKFNELNDIPTYHKEVKTFEVTENDGTFVGLLYIDLFPRKTKRGGAWMNAIKSQGLQSGKVQRPHIMIVGNLTPATDDTPSLMLRREVETVFHEFGHALHGLLSDCTYTSLASPNVYWDFVELPSQIMENWVAEKDALNLFAKHYQTGENIPDELLKKVKAAENFHKATMNIRQLNFGFIDMAWHNQDPTDVKDVTDFENKALEKMRLLPHVKGSLISTAFAHIFAGGYSAGYYSYKWAEVLDADAFEKFKHDGIFNRETAESFRRNILARGNTEHPMVLYKRFRGQEPDPDALLRRDGLL